MFNEEKYENILFLAFLSPVFPLTTPKVFKRPMLIISRVSTSSKF